jgi:phosphomannomutase/phosphoglucomutase
LLEILAKSDQTPTEVLSSLPKSFSTPELNLQMQEGETQPFVEEFVNNADFEGAEVSTIDGLRADFEDGWGLVRASNTTPVLVLRFEADSRSALLRIQEKFREEMLKVREDLVMPF